MTANADRAAQTASGRPRDAYLPVDGGRLRFRDEGEGPAVLLVHGWTLDLEMWDPQVAGLGRRFRLIRFDRRGFGLSSGCASRENDVADIDALCRHLALHRLSVIGMSQGARAVLEWAAGAPGRVQCLVLDGPPEIDGTATGETDVPLAHYRRLIRERGIRAFRREWSAHPLAQLVTPDPGARRLLATMIERYPANDLRDSPPSSAEVPARARIETITAPTLIISGERDLASRRAAAQGLVRRLPCAEHAVIAGAGHLPNLDNPDVYNHTVAAFLNRRAAAPA